MTINFYRLVNILLSITVFAGASQTLLHFIIGAALFRQETFLTFFVIQIIIFLFTTVLLIRYLWFKNFKLVFLANVGFSLSTLVHSSMIFLVFLTQREQSLYFPTLIFSVGLSLIYGLSLFFSNSRNNYWLKISGIYIFIVNLPLVISIVWLLINPGAQTIFYSEKSAPWLALLQDFVPIFFILNFRSEVKHLKIKKELSAVVVPSRYWQWLAMLLGIIVLVFVLQLSTKVYWTLHWANRSFSKAKELAGKFESRIFISNRGDTLYYRFLKPMNFDRTKRYPLLVSLPYGGQPGTDKIRQLEGAGAAEVLSTKENMKKYPSFIFVPNCPAGSGWGGMPGYLSVDSLVYEAIVFLNKEPGLDVKRRYVTGISRGGYGTWKFITTRPDLFAAAIPVCGGGDPRRAARAINVSIWAFHGQNDKNVPVSNSRNMISVIRRAGGHPKYTEFTNEGHDIWYQTSTIPGLWDWLFAQRQK